MFVLQKSFGCLSLRTGGLIIGWLGVVGVAMLEICCAALLAITFDGYFMNSDFIVEKCVENDVQDCDSILRFNQILTGIAIVLLLVYLLKPIFLILGIFKNRRNYLKTWLAVNCITMAGLVLRFVNHVFHQSETAAFFTLLNLAIAIYFHSIVHSLHLEMEDVKYVHV